MPSEALPVNRTAPPKGTVTLRRTYVDALNRPLTGSITLTGTKTTTNGGVVHLGAAPVTVALVGGLLEVDLPPDTYRLTAALRTVDGHRITSDETVTVS